MDKKSMSRMVNICVLPHFENVSDIRRSAGYIYAGLAFAAS